MSANEERTQVVDEYCKDYYQLVKNKQDFDEGFLNKTMEFYRANAEIYNQTHDPEHCLYLGPSQCADRVQKYLGDRYDAKILDVACGSGILGNELTKRGYRNLEGIDGNAKMLDIARERKIYAALHQGFIGTGSSGQLDGKYDVACVSGGFIPGHIPPSGLKEVVEKVKPGGYAVVIMNESLLPYYKDLTPLDYVSKIYMAGTIDEVTITRTKGYFDGENGVLLVFRVV